MKNQERDNQEVVIDAELTEEELESIVGGCGRHKPKKLPCGGGINRVVLD